MILTNKYRRISAYQAINEINKVFKENGHHELTKEQIRILRETWGDRGILGDLDMPFMWYSWDNNYSRSGIWWRLTLLAWLLYALFCFVIVMPFNWITKGSVYGQDGKPCKMIKSIHTWYVRIFNK